MLTNQQIKQLHIEFVKLHGCVDELLDKWFNRFPDKSLAIKLWNEMWLEGELDHPENYVNKLASATKWVADCSSAAKLAQYDNVEVIGHLATLDGWIPFDKRPSGYEFSFPNGSKTIVGFTRSFGYDRLPGRAFQGYLWDSTKTKRLYWDNIRGTFLFEKIVDQSNSLANGVKKGWTKF